MSCQDDRFQLATRLYIEFVSSTATKQALDDGDEPQAVHEDLANRAIMASETFFEQMTHRATVYTASPRFAGVRTTIGSVA